MTELEILDRDILGLKELLRVAWMELARSSLSAHERRETRNRITICSAELRRHLEQLEASRIRKQQPEESDRRSTPKPQLRLLLPEGY